MHFIYRRFIVFILIIYISLLGILGIFLLILFTILAHFECFWFCQFILAKFHFFIVLYILNSWFPLIVIFLLMKIEIDVTCIYRRLISITTFVVLIVILVLWIIYIALILRFILIKLQTIFIHNFSCSIEILVSWMMWSVLPSSSFFFSIGNS
jgi:hypothetical protein